MDEEQQQEMYNDASGWVKRRIALNQSTTGVVTASVTYEGTLTKEEVVQGAKELMAEAIELAKQFSAPIGVKKK